MPVPWEAPEFTAFKQTVREIEFERLTGIPYPKPPVPREVMDMKINVVDTSRRVVLAWADLYGKLGVPKRVSLEIVEGSILNRPCEGLVSPANSFGFMDGGLDALYSQVWPDVPRQVQDAIRLHPYGELLVGQAFSLRIAYVAIKSACVGPSFDPQPVKFLDQTPEGKPCHLIVAPTMRLPGTRLQGTLSAYLATKAAVTEAIRLNLREISIPGMGTGSGGMNPHVSALQMWAGIQDALNPRPEFQHWHQAKLVEDALIRGVITGSGVISPGPV